MSALRLFVLVRANRFFGRYRDADPGSRLAVGRDRARVRLVAAQQMDMDLISAEPFPMGCVLGGDIDVPKPGETPGAENGAQIAEAPHRQEDRAGQGRTGLRPVDGMD